MLLRRVLDPRTDQIPAQIYNSAVVGNCMRDSYDWSVTFTFLLGDVLWQPAVIFQVGSLAAARAARVRLLCPKLSWPKAASQPKLEAHGKGCPTSLVWRSCCKLTEASTGSPVSPSHRG